MATKPAGYRVMLKVQKLEDVDPALASAKRAGIQLLEQSERKEETKIDTGTVLDIGPTAFENCDKPWCEIGDIVAYARHSGKKVVDPFDQEEYLIINDEDIVAVFSPKEEK